MARDKRHYRPNTDSNPYAADTPSSRCPPGIQLLISRLNAVGGEGIETALGELESSFDAEMGSDLDRIRLSDGDFAAIDSRYSKSLLGMLPEIKPLLSDLSDDEAPGFSMLLGEVWAWLTQRGLLRSLITFRTLHTYPRKRPDMLLSFSVQIAITSEGEVLFPSEYAILNVLVETPGIVSRLRICPVCDKLYWARRLSLRRTEASTCGDRSCSNTFHQRRSRFRKCGEELKAIGDKVARASKTLPDRHPLIIENESRLIAVREKLKLMEEKYGDL